MARGKVKAKEHEKLDDESVQRVIEYLDSGATKKSACEMLNISYNTSRLSRIIEEYNGRKNYADKRRKQLRGKPFDASEIRYTVLNYLKGDSMSALAKAQYRSVQGVKNVLAEYSIPERDSTNNYWKPSMIPEDSTSQDFEDGELVWSARYNCVAEIRHLFHYDEAGEHGKIYLIWTFGKHNEAALQPWYELGKLDILKELGVSNDDFEDFETKGLFYSIR